MSSVYLAPWQFFGIITVACWTVALVAHCCALVRRRRRWARRRGVLERGRRA